jgi:hypothetical protein
MKRAVLRYLAIVFALGFVAIQAVRPERTNPPVDAAREWTAHVAVPPDVGRVLARACADCHSHQTRWPWYSHIAPASWLVIDHVNHGRKHLNLSDWIQEQRHGAGPPSSQLDLICKTMRGGSMPLRSYTLVHRNAVVSREEVERVCAWTAGR